MIQYSSSNHIKQKGIIETMGKPEGTIENYLIKKATENNCLCYKFVSPGKRGVPDRIVIGKGKTIFVELKSETGSLRKQQEYRIQQMIEHGADVRVLNTKEKIDKFFEELK